MHEILIVAGPTAAGKTEVAMALQDLCGGRDAVRLISMDSALVYREMNIGTAKPSAEELAAHPHDLIDLIDPADSYSVADYVTAADASVRAAWSAGQVPLLVGGTMLYAKRFIEGIARLPPSDPILRAQLELAYETEGPQALHDRLGEHDPQAAAAIHPHNRQRVLRALEVALLAGRAMSGLWDEAAGMGARERLQADAIHLYGVMPDDRRSLHARIEQRFEAMLAAGFVDEVCALRARGDLRPDMPSMRAVGYRQAWQYLEGTLDESAFHANAVTATRRLAKRQMTWLRGFLDIELVPWGDAQKTARKILRSAKVKAL